MNIFAFHSSPYTSALWLDDVRKNKMILETAQLLSTTVHQLAPQFADLVYKQTHLNHPCAIWARTSWGNHSWLMNYFFQLCKSNFNHKSFSLYQHFKKLTPDMFHEINQTPFANCAANAGLGVSFKHIDNVHKAYRLYINERWRHDTIKLSWNNGQQPYWKE